VFLLQPGPDVNQALGPQVGVLPDAVFVTQPGNKLGCALSALQLPHGALQGGVIFHCGEQIPGGIRADRVQLGGGVPKSAFLDDRHRAQGSGITKIGALPSRMRTGEYLLRGKRQQVKNHRTRYIRSFGLRVCSRT
jgi:hypothetical protein